MGNGVYIGCRDFVRVEREREREKEEEIWFVCARSLHTPTHNAHTHTHTHTHTLTHSLTHTHTHTQESTLQEARLIRTGNFKDLQVLS